MSAFSIAALEKRRELAEQMKDLSKNFEVCICYLISAHVGFDVKHTANHLFIWWCCSHSKIDEGWWNQSQLLRVSRVV